MTLARLLLCPNSECVAVNNIGKGEDDDDDEVEVLGIVQIPVWLLVPLSGCVCWLN